jgi:hypothetical protein
LPSQQLYFFDTATRFIPKGDECLKVFGATGSPIIQVFSSIDDIKKAQLYEYKELKGLSLEEKKQILSEYRPAIMEWFYLKPRI